MKSFITTALEAASKRAAQSSWNKKALGSENFVALEQAVKQRYPELILFDDWGINAQNIEGAILRDVILQGIDKDIVVLPVHDAVAVQQKHEQWAVECAVFRAVDAPVPFKAGTPFVSFNFLCYLPLQ